MAYEITKRIKGREYRYIVEPYLDPETNRRKMRWQYAGAVENGEVRAPRTRTPRNRVTRNDIIAATARLLQTRNPEHITVDVLAAGAGASRSAFYRHFRNQQEAMDAAMLHMADEGLHDLPPLDQKPRDLHEAKGMLREWCEGLARSSWRRSLLQRLLRQPFDKKIRLRMKCSQNRASLERPLALFLEHLNDAGFAMIEDPPALVRAIKGMHLASRVATVLTKPAHDLPLAESEEVYRLIERAVFGASSQR
jgi:AcrR family transcriptional regulator